MHFRLVPKSSTLDDLELLYVRIFTEFCANMEPGIVLRFTRRRHYTNAVARWPLRKLGFLVAIGDKKKGKQRKGQVHTVTSWLCFSNMGSRPRWTDFHKNWQGCRGPWRNHLLQV